jgi:pimeloyl-ACP methyl ester carboxylesterase
MMLPTRQALLSVLVAFLVGIAFMPTLASAQVQVPNPTPRPKVVPNPNATLPAPKPAATNPAAKPASTAQVEDIPAAGAYPVGRVIVLRGLGNVFSRGMDAIAKDLKARGVNVNLQNHSRWQSISAKLIEEYRANPQQVAPIILIGHSLGGDASIVMANWLIQNRVPVRLVVVFDAVAQVHPVNAGVEEVINFYKPKGYGKEVKASANFKGTINNVDLTDRTDIDHLNIDKDPIIQQEVIASVMKILATANGAKPVRKATPVAKAAPAAEATPPASGTAPATGAPPAEAASAPAPAPTPAPAPAPQETADAVAPAPAPPPPAETVPEPIPATAAD